MTFSLDIDIVILKSNKTGDRFAEVENGRYKRKPAETENAEGYKNKKTKPVLKRAWLFVDALEYYRLKRLKAISERKLICLLRLLSS